jgi:putative transposase
MSHSLTKVWIHAIFRTKNSSLLITKDFESKLYKYLIDMFSVELSCVVKILNGTSNHIHILFLLNPNFALKDIMHRIKGSSSHWIN